MASSKKIDFRIFLLIVFSYLVSHLNSVRSEAIDMQLSLSSRLEKDYDLSLKARDLVGQVSLNKAIKDIVVRDLEARKAIIESKLPKDLAGREFIEKFVDYANVRLIDDADCLLRLYKEGDEVWVFEQESELKKSKGFLLKRGDEIIHLVILELILV